MTLRRLSNVCRVLKSPSHPGSLPNLCDKHKNTLNISSLRSSGFGGVSQYPAFLASAAHFEILEI